MKMKYIGSEKQRGLFKGIKKDSVWYVEIVGSIPTSNCIVCQIRNGKTYNSSSIVKRRRYLSLGSLLKDWDGV